MLTTDIIIRPLEINDYYLGFLQLLEQLTQVGDITFEQFREQFIKINANNANNANNVFVIYSKSKNLIIGCGTLLIEYKFIHQLGCVGHLEDIVIHSKYRKIGLGKKIVDYLITKAKENGCYKVILNSKHSVTKFYEQCGLTIKDIQMVKYF